MTLQELIRAVEQLTPQERRELWAYLDEHQAGQNEEVPQETGS